MRRGEAGRRRRRRRGHPALEPATLRRATPAAALCPRDTTGHTDPARRCAPLQSSVETNTRPASEDGDPAADRGAAPTGCCWRFGRWRIVLVLFAGPGTDEVRGECGQERAESGVDGEEVHGEEVQGEGSGEDGPSAGAGGGGSQEDGGGGRWRREEFEPRSAPPEALPEGEAGRWDAGQGSDRTLAMVLRSDQNKDYEAEILELRSLLEDKEREVIKVLFETVFFPFFDRELPLRQPAGGVRLKTIDFGLSIFFRPGEIFTDVVGSPYYVAPEVLQKHYGPEVDVWSAGVIIYILLSGVPPFWAETEQGIFEQVLNGSLDFESDPWPSISESAKDLVRRMLVRDPKKRVTAHEVLCHPWVQVDGVAPDKPLDSAVLSRLKQFSAMNKLKKMALRVIAESLSEDEIAGLKELFKMIDTDNSGQITFEELKAGLERVGANLKESEIYALMQAADVDNSGTIDYLEFIAATLHLNKIEREDHLFAAFSYFDKDGSGYITHDELEQACEEFGVGDVRLEEMIREVDQDNDGRIDYNEFVAMMQKGNGGFGMKGLQHSFSIGFREALKLG